MNKTLFFTIIGVALVALIGMVLAYLYVPAVGPQPVAIQVVVAPSIEPWADQAAQTFNETGGATQVEIVTANELIPGPQFRVSDPQESPPAAWLAEATFVVDWAQKEGLSFTDPRPVAGAGLAWGAYNDKLAAFEQSYGPLTWQSLNARATNPDDTLKLVIASPQNSAEGLAALISATAAHLGIQAVSGSDIGAANQWLIDTLGDRRAYTPPTPAQSFASVQGRTLGDAGLLSMASWRSAGLDQAEDFTLIPVEPHVSLNYPFVIWAGRQATPEGRQAAAEFRDFLLSEAQQQALADFFLSPAGVEQNAIQADGAAAQRLLDWSNRELR